MGVQCEKERCREMTQQSSAPARASSGWNAGSSARHLPRGKHWASSDALIIGTPRWHLWRVLVGAVRRQPQTPLLKGIVRSEGSSEKAGETLKADSHFQDRRLGEKPGSAA